MKLRTRNFRPSIAGILTLGFVSSLVSCVQGSFPVSAIAQSRPDELRYVSEDVNILAYANVRDVMLSDLRQRLGQIAPAFDHQREFLSQMGIDIESDIDQVVAGLMLALEPGDRESRAIIVLSGRFDMAQLEVLARDDGSTVEEYKGTRLLKMRIDDNQFAMAFIETGVIALGSESTVRRAIELPSTGGDVTTNTRLMELMSHIEEGANAWAVGEFDGREALAWLPDQVESQIPPVDAFAVGGRFNGGVNTSITAETRNAEAGQDLRNVVQIFLALARMRSRSQPELSVMLDTVKLSNAGSTVTLSFVVPAEVLEMVLRDRVGKPR